MRKITFDIEDDVIKNIEDAAAVEDRSLGAQLRVIIKEWLNGK